MYRSDYHLVDYIGRTYNNLQATFKKFSDIIVSLVNENENPLVGINITDDTSPNELSLSIYGNYIVILFSTILITTEEKSEIVQGRIQCYRLSRPKQANYTEIWNVRFEENICINSGDNSFLFHLNDITGVRSFLITLASLSIEKEDSEAAK